MGFFNRRPRDGAEAGTAPRNTATRAPREPYDIQTRPSFGQWLRHSWLDILTMAAMGALGLGIYEAHPAPTRSFAVTFPTDGEVVYPEFAYPMRKEIVPIFAAALLAALVPIFVFLVMQIRIRSFWDFHNATMGLLYSLITAAVFQVFIKWLIGGLRPHFLDVCKPDLSRAVSAGEYNNAGFNNIYFTADICTGDRDEIDDSLESMPSGHTTAAFAGFVYLYLYLNAKLKVFSNHSPHMWKLVVLYAPILGACLIGGALTIDEFHNWYDVLAGAVIGTVMAFSAYRMKYAAIWDWRYNHIPLHYMKAFSHHEPELGHATFTRRVNWGPGGAGFKEHGYGYGSGAGTGTGIHRKPVGTAGNVRGDNIV